MSVVTTTRPRVEVLIQRRLLDITEAGKYLGVSHKVIRQLVQAGELPYIQRVRGRSPYLIDIRDLDQWIDLNKARAT
jgi:excisionase family DNA binding protein